MLTPKQKNYSANVIGSKQLGAISGKMKKYISLNFSEKALERAFADMLPGARGRAGR